MKKILILSLSATMLISSCGGSGYSDTVYTTSSLGAVLGSAIGGLAGGHRGHDIGTIVGMAGGAVLGAAIESNAENQRKKHFQEINAKRNNMPYETETSNTNTESSGFDPNNSGDDTLYGDFGLPEVPASSLSTQASEKKGIEVQNIRFIDDNNDIAVNPNEICKITFEIINNSNKPAYNVMPSVVETTGNKNIFISQGICVEEIRPYRGVRYTAMIKANKKLKEGKLKLRIKITQDGVPVETGIQDIEIATRK